MDDIDVPLFYLVSRQLPPEQVPAVLSVLLITPIDSVIVSDVHDVELATHFCKPFFLAKDEPEALASATELALKHQRRALVIGEVSSLQACYADGHQEEIACSSFPRTSSATKP